MSLGDTKSRVALVTGASRGIGRGIAVELARAGYHVAVNYARNRDAAVDVCVEIQKLDRCAIPVAGDVSDSSDRMRMLDETVSGLGSISLLVNNAGIAPRVRADLLEATEDSFDEIVGTNLRGPYFLTQECARRMLEWKRTGDVAHARIVFVTSMSAYTASTNRGDYCISKAGLSMVAKLFAARLAADGIGVYEVQPGIIRTDMTAKVTEKYDRLITEEGVLPIPRWGTPEDVGMAVRAIAEGRFDYSTGVVIPVDGGFHLRIL